MTISLCVITKDNAGTIVNCLSSVSSLVDEIVVVDTGSSDNTKELCSSVGDLVKVYDYSWNWNFSDAKNFALSKATGDWVLALDADEVISSVDHSKILRAISVASDDGILGISLIQRNYSNELGGFGWTSTSDDSYPESKVASGFVSRRMVRLFRNISGIKFSGAVHDSVEPSINSRGSSVLDTDIPIHHYGALSRDNLSRRKLYLEIELKNLREGDYFQNYQIASQYHSIGESQKALEFIDKSLLINPDFYLAHLEKGLVKMKLESFDEAFDSLKVAEDLLIREKATPGSMIHLSEVLGGLGVVYSKMNNYHSALKCYRRALFLSPNNATHYFNLGLLLLSMNNKSEALQSFKEAIRLNPKFDELVKITDKG